MQKWGSFGTGQECETECDAKIVKCKKLRKGQHSQEETFVQEISECDE